MYKFLASNIGPDYKTCDEIPGVIFQKYKEFEDENGDGKKTEWNEFNTGCWPEIQPKFRLYYKDNNGKTTMSTLAETSAHLSKIKELDPQFLEGKIKLAIIIHGFESNADPEQANFAEPMAGAILNNDYQRLV